MRPAKVPPPARVMTAGCLPPALTTTATMMNGARKMMLKGHPGIRRHIFWTIGFSWSEIGRGSTGSRCSSARAREVRGHDRHGDHQEHREPNQRRRGGFLPTFGKAGGQGRVDRFLFGFCLVATITVSCAGRGARRVESRRGWDWLRRAHGGLRDLRRGHPAAASDFGASLA